ncbi:hypothetical protein [Paracoccus haeundaensis]|uniref:Uncharacterized protein n=1 Tax=Paracoccus haeundaensis TaxID=225362 RepID=A0A5C4R4I7_9RHOB|nr:hypothetical protein [Paracoccus haeundaensis]TNH38825.1 hypothetical protein FHD67_13215 [Paracoccus haeundaensis]
MLVPIIIAGIVTGTFAALMSLASGTGLIFAAYIYAVAGGFAVLISAVLFSLRFIVSKIWWSLNIDLRVNIIIAHIASISAFIFISVVIFGISGNFFGSLASLAVGALGIPAWLSYSFDNFVAKGEDRYAEDYL